MSKDIFNKVIVILFLLITFVVIIISYKYLKPNAYEVIVNNNPVAYVKKEEDFNKINREVDKYVKERFNLNTNNKVNFNKIRVRGDIFTNNNFIKKSILENSNIKIKAFNVKVGNEFLGTLLNKNEIKHFSEIIRKRYSTDIMEDIKIKQDIVRVENINTIDELVTNIEKSNKLKNFIKTKKLSRGSVNICFLMPSSGCITSSFGKRWGKFHKGIDIGAPQGAPIYASYDGKVIYTGWEDGYGKVIKIRHNSDIITVYGHCSKLNVNLDQYVKKGEKIGEVGSTGRSTGPHVHFEVRKNDKACNPLLFIK